MAVIICLHGLGSSGHAFDQLVAAMPGHTFITPDFAGFGSRVAEHISSAPLTVAAEECTALLDAQTSPTTVIGHSMGGAVAMLAASAMPHKVAGLISLEGNLIAEDCGLISRKFAATESELDLISMKNDLVRDTRASNMPGWQAWADDAAPVLPSVFGAYARHLVELSDSAVLLAHLKNFAGPKGYIYSDDYLGHPVLDQLAPVAKTHIADAGHLVMVDQPQRCAAAIKQLLNMR